MTSLGVLREIKDHEYRVALTPAGARELVRRGNTVLVETEAGAGSRMPDEEYRVAGARIVERAVDVVADCDVVLKVKEPVDAEYGWFREGLVIFTYLHLAANSRLTSALMTSAATAIGYETVATDAGTLPLLVPMSQIAGRMAPQVGAASLERPRGGRGVLLSGVPGVVPARVVVVGGGTAGTNAARIAAGMGAEVIVFDKDLTRLGEIDATYRGHLRTAAVSTGQTVAEAVIDADMVIGTVLVPGAAAPKMIDEDAVSSMKEGAVIVDVSIDQGGCVATSHMTTHSDPVYEKHGVVHYCVGNMPGAVPRTATIALTNATLPYVFELADRGVAGAVVANAELGRGVNVWQGKLVEAAVATSLGVSYDTLSDIMEIAS